ncbi:hypothetical protein ACJROX_14640 [Pseudalkalibacillus sp. A8]
MARNKMSMTETIGLNILDIQNNTSFFGLKLIGECLLQRMD